MTNTTPCETCAFVSGTVANRSELTILKATLSVEARDPFYCHEAIKRICDEGFTQDEAMMIARQDGELRLCAGYVEAVKLMAESGFYDNQTAEEVETRKRLSDAICDYENVLIAGQK